MRRFMSFAFAAFLTIASSAVIASATIAPTCPNKIAIRNPDGTTNICVLQGSDGHGTCVYDC